MSEYYIVQPDELYHHGVIGMHWGIRRYQNYDGSLTSKGRSRVASLSRKQAKLQGRVQKRNAKISNINESFAKSKKKEKLLIKKAKLERKAATLSPKNQKIRDKKQMYNIDPSRKEQKNLKREYYVNEKLGKVNKQLLGPEIKTKKLELKNLKTEHKIEKIRDKISDLNTPQPKYKLKDNVSAKKPKNKTYDRIDKYIAKYGNTYNNLLNDGIKRSAGLNYVQFYSDNLNSAKQLMNGKISLEEHYTNLANNYFHQDKKPKKK